MKKLYAALIFLAGLVGGVVWWALRNRERARLAEAKRVAAAELAAARAARAEREAIRKKFGELSSGVKDRVDNSIREADEKLRERLADAGKRAPEEVEADYRRLLGLPPK